MTCNTPSPARVNVPVNAPVNAPPVKVFDPAAKAPTTSSVPAVKPTAEPVPAPDNPPINK